MDKMHVVNIQYFTAKREDGGGVVAKGTLPGQGTGPGSCRARGANVLRLPRWAPGTGTSVSLKPVRVSSGSRDPWLPDNPNVVENAICFWLEPSAECPSFSMF